MAAIADINVWLDLLYARLQTQGNADPGVNKKVYNPQGFVTTPGVCTWMERSGGVATGFPRFSLSVRPPSKASRIHKVTAKLDYPTLEVAGGSTSAGYVAQPQRAYSHQAVAEFMIPERGSDAERVAFYSTFVSLLMTSVVGSGFANSTNTNSPVINALRNFDAPY